MKKLKYLFIVIIFYTSLSYPNQECDFGHDAFKKSLHPFVVKRCSLCHGDKSPLPRHSASDSKVAYSTMLKFVDFTNISGSHLIKKVAQKHWSRGGGTPPDIGAEVSEVLPLIKEWYDKGQYVCEGNYDFISHSLVVEGLPDRKSGNYKEMIFDLSETSKELDQVYVRFKIQRFSPRDKNLPGSYRVKDLSILTSIPLAINNVQISVSDQVAPYENIYTQLDVDVPAKNHWQILSNEHMILIQRNDEDYLNLKIRELNFIK